MTGYVSIEKLCPHPKNNVYFSDITGEKYDEIKRSITTHGIRDPLKVTPDYKIIAGHQRFRIAQDVGLTTIPVVVYDVDEVEAEYHLIADNTERRGEAESDPIKKARIAEFLKRYWEIRNGGDRRSEDHNGPLKTLDDVAEYIGESRTNTKRLLKLNDLIPQLQALVSAGTLGTTAAEQLAYLTPDEQQALFDALGVEIGKRTVADTKSLRSEIERLRSTERSLRDTIESLRDQEPEVVEVIPQHVTDRLTKLEEREAVYKRQLDDEREKIRRYEEHVVELNTEIETYKQTSEYDGLSPRSALFVNRQLEITSECNAIAEKLVVMALDVPQDLPEFSRAIYAKAVERLSRVAGSTLQSLTQIGYQPIEIRGEIVNE